MRKNFPRIDHTGGCLILFGLLFIAMGLLVIAVSNGLWALAGCGLFTLACGVYLMWEVLERRGR